MRKNARDIWRDATKRGKAKIRAHFFGFYNELIHEMMTKKLCDDACLQLRALIKNCFLSSFESNLEVSSTLPGCDLSYQSECTWTFLGRDCDLFVVLKHASTFFYGDTMLEFTWKHNFSWFCSTLIEILRVISATQLQRRFEKGSFAAFGHFSCFIVQKIKVV